MRVLLAFEQQYRAYREALRDAIRMFHSGVEVVVADSADLEAEVERWAPQLVILDHRAPENPVDAQPSRIELSPEPDQSSRFRVGERRWESMNPTLGEILPVIDETRRLLRTTQQQAPTDAGEAEV